MSEHDGAREATGPQPPYGQVGPPSYGQPGPGLPGPAPYQPAPYQPVPYGYVQPPYGQVVPTPYGYAVVARPTNGMAIASMVLGILWLYWIGSILALVFGYVARAQIKQRGEAGGGMAIAGIVLGWVGVAAAAVPLLVLGIAST